VCEEENHCNAEKKVKGDADNLDKCAFAHGVSPVMVVSLSDFDHSRM
jgi:hypothetical protein